ncbi:hypothetical protein ACJROX_06175 [Pseudalkalibacillus sp. A8]|uniref:hypothetical protein n=1 Tax=Pseudalkalibacillus sp. A8 TaxID=3382641 RepID=UPI0038B5DB21
MPTKYEEIMQEIEVRMRDGRLKPGSRLPWSVLFQKNCNAVSIRLSKPIAN